MDNAVDIFRPSNPKLQIVIDGKILFLKEIF